MSEDSKPSSGPRQPRWDWTGAALCGGIATAPLVVGIVGWAQSWNVHTNLTYTLGWAVFAVGLLAAGIALRVRPARMAAIGLLTVAVMKAFLHDLGRLGGLYRVGSFVGLAICLALVAIALQKFVMTPRETR